MVIKQILLASCFGAILAASANAGTLAQFRTVFGTIDVELYDQEKPVTAGNFKRLVKSGAYHNTFMHRLIPGFVAQGGSYYSFNKANTNLFAPPWSGYGQVPNFGPIVNEYSVGPTLSNTNGTIAMAKVAGNPDSATTGWFFNLANNASVLDGQNGGFTVFGRVIRDADNVLGALNAYVYTNGLINMGWWYPANDNATNLFATLPVWYSGPFHPRYSDLFYVDISLLELSVSQTNGFPILSWNAVPGKTNIVESSPTLPPQWQTIFSAVPGTGTISLIDNVSKPPRFYRVRVVY